MKAVGEIINNKIIIEKPKDVGRFYNKSQIGKTVSGNKLELNFLEAIFLLGEGKIRIFEKQKEKNFEELFKTAAEKTPNFEIKYLIYKDLRKRGNFVKISDEKDIFDFFIDKNCLNEKSCFISIFSERSKINISEIIGLIQKAVEKKRNLWFAVVDEEADITYYDVGKINLRGKIKPHKFSKNIGYLFKNRVIVFDKKSVKNLFEKEFFGKAFGDGIQLSMVEALYLSDAELLEIRNSKENKKISYNKFKDFIKKSQPDIDMLLSVFKDLKNRCLLVKTGFKFGVHFRVYTRKPDETHAEYLVHVVDKKYNVIWAEISRAVRLAHSVNKELIFTKIDGKNIDYIKFGRLRP